MTRAYKFIGVAFLYLFLLAITIFAIFPILYSVLSSFKTNLEFLTSTISLLPKKFTFENYQQAWEIADFKRYTFNSLYMTFFIVVGVLLNSTMAGYVFARARFPGRDILFSVFISTMFVSFGSFTLFPILQVAKFLHINTTLWGVILIKVIGLNVTNIFLVRTYIRSLPIEIEEAARIDGCSFFRIYWNIVLPLLKPIIATVGLITFQAAWNDYLMPMVFTLPNPEQAPLIVGIVSLKNTGEAASSWNLMLAGTSISILPMIAVYLCLNRYFIAGLTNGAVKG